MYVLTLTCKEHGHARNRELRGLIACASEGPTPDYWVSLSGLDREPFSRGLLPAFPRWSEPVRAFVARAIDVVLQNLEEGPPVVHCEAAELRVLDWRTNHIVDQVELRASPPMSNALPPSAPHSIGLNPWKAMLDACAFDAFGATGVPAAPPPLQPLVYAYGGIKYCRTKDLPLEAQVVAERSLSRQTRPFVPSVPDAVYPWSLHAFLRNEFDDNVAPCWSWP